MKDKGFRGRVVYIEGCYRIVERGAIRGLCSTKEEALDRAVAYTTRKHGPEFLIKMKEAPSENKP